jgi:prevent-host-death family protein
MAFGTTLKHMRRIGIRELQQHASRWVRQAAAGESFEVTDRGRPVARLVPIPEQETGLAALERAGRLSRGTGRSMLDIEPAPRVPGSRSLSEILQEMRDEDPR